MDNANLFISNIHSTLHDIVSITCIYDSLSKEACRGCGLYYEIYESRFIGLLRHHLSQLNEPDAEKLRQYAESQGTRVDDETYRAALNAEQECRTEIARDQM
ncbi:dpoa decarboxylase [Citrobacter koseri]|uniref:dpoa decarboxylase n=1 Tax=Citrobacter koseri TaxID=545 RepID=UPI002B3BBD15|nr:dpoa decarboxylase [Citrobacter koseri]MEB2703993.1 dpoa decarboxylase [Citrobacter koseri]MEB2709626.1 dpoa decarboxylase [Citrobacter koseri]